MHVGIVLPSLLLLHTRERERELAAEGRDGGGRERPQASVGQVAVQCPKLLAPAAALLQAIKHRARVRPGRRDAFFGLWRCHRHVTTTLCERSACNGVRKGNRLFLGFLNSSWYLASAFAPFANRFFGSCSLFGSSVFGKFGSN